MTDVFSCFQDVGWTTTSAAPLRSRITVLVWGRGDCPMSHCLDPRCLSPDRHLLKMPWSSWTRWVLIGGCLNAYLDRNGKKSTVKSWRDVSICLLSEWRVMISIILTHKMSWLEFRRHPESDWKMNWPRMWGSRSACCSQAFVSTVKRV